MFRISQLLKTFHDDLPANKAHKMPGPVVIWNLIRRCNLRCKHSVSYTHLTLPTTPYV